MKLDKITLVFILIFLSINLFIRLDTNEISDISLEKVEYSKALESAVDDGVFNLVEVDKNKSFILTKENAVEQFFISLAANFGVIGNKQQEEMLKLYVPLVLVTDIDGFYIYYSSKISMPTETILIRNWSEKYTFPFEEGNYIYYFTLGKGVKIVDKSTSTVYEGNYDEMDLLPNSLLGNPERYEQTRRNTIINTIQGKMLYYINNHNHIAQEYGLQYHFWLPEVDTDDFYRTIDDVSMMVIFQGYPYRKSYETFNRYSFSAARIKKTRKYYITEINNRKYYHREECEDINQEEDVYYTPEESALQGAFPCMKCFY